MPVLDVDSILELNQDKDLLVFSVFVSSLMFIVLDY